jgi:hypothetical protein
MNAPIADAQIIIMPDSILRVSDTKGKASVNLEPGRHFVSVFHLQFQQQQEIIELNRNKELKLNMDYKTSYLQDVRVTGQSYRDDLTTIRIDPRAIYNMPSATGDFTKVLSTLPGVSSNNEFSSTYSVRGGNYDENLVYVNGIKIYRPQIISAGRQEGLSFINMDLVKKVEFSAGGWEAAYGDKLSSVLRVNYKEPEQHEASINMSLLGGSLYLGGVSKNNKWNYTLSARHKNTRYLLGTLETQGEYLPRFTDVQSFITRHISDKTKIGLLISTAINNYETIPERQTTDFGNLQASYRLNVAFDGREQLDYLTSQAGVILTHTFSSRLKSTLSFSGVRSFEKENYEIEAGYLLCDVNTNFGSNRFNECVNTLGVGTNYNYGRNQLKASIVSAEQKNELKVGEQLLQFGMSWDHERIEDRLDEYEFIDSADYVTVTEVLDSEATIESDKVAGYVQMLISNKDKSHRLNVGLRANYWSYSGQTLVSPRVQYAHEFGHERRNTIRASAGIYSQHPFYRELRDREGQINKDVRAQESVHTLLGWDRHMFIWGRSFLLSAEGFYKYMWNINPYDIENVKIRYFATNQAKAYAYGFDFRMHGEFIEGTESWFSFGYLKTEENLFNGNGYGRRPMDQRLHMGIFFQDHIPNDPSIKVDLSLQFGSGLPFGPPGDDDNRNVFDGDHYTRVDIGFSKSFEFQQKKTWLPKSLWLGAEVLNLLGTDNALTYTWIKDVSNNTFAVPNALSARFLNVRIVGKF